MIVTLHGGLSLYTIQMILSFSGLLFSTIMIGTNHDIGVYYPVMTSILGYWFPSPMLLSIKIDSTKITSNPHVMLFGTQCLMSFIVLMFSSIMLYYDGQPSTFLPVITGIVAMWFPHPSLESEPNVNNDLNIGILHA